MFFDLLWSEERIKLFSRIINTDGVVFCYTCVIVARVLSKFNDILINFMHKSFVRPRNRLKLCIYMYINILENIKLKNEFIDWVASWKIRIYTLSSSSNHMYPIHDLFANFIINTAKEFLNAMRFCDNIVSAQWMIIYTLYLLYYICEMWMSQYPIKILLP